MCFVRVYITMAQDDRDSLKLLKTMRGEVNWEIVDERCAFLNQFYLLIENWQGQLPNLKSIFRPEEIDWLLTEDVKIFERVGRLHRIPIANFVYNTGYEDEPVVDEDGKPLTRRTTAIHYSASCKISELIGDLFEIYSSVDVNYTDDSGFTHFHAACMSSECYNVVELFLEQGLDPNLLVPKTGESPLHLALRWGRNKVAQLLLRNGADPNLTNAEGLTPLHIICKRGEDDTGVYRKGDCVTVKMLLELSSEKYQPVQIDARDKLGNTPLHLVLDYGHRRLIELLLKNGADPNSINEHGFTPLHIISMRKYDEALAKLFFEINDKMNQKVEVDAKDKFGRTPLQWAVAKLLPSEVDALLERGADLSNFVFPTEDYFGVRLGQWNQSMPLRFQFRLTSGALGVVGSLEKRGYELDRSQALMIMKIFAKHGLFEKPAILGEAWYDDEKFVREAKEIIIRPNLSFYGLIQLRPEEAAELLTWFYAGTLLPLSEGPREAFALHVCEKVSRRFFQSWALDCFLELIHCRLPILCCDMIIEELLNEDLYNICLAVEGQNS
uniref:Uncharacterized protein n=1 Tax=Trichogramma kaykai TaxID=54128 RepID=A0ABD2XE89_9HYME